MLQIELISISNMGVSLIETCFCLRLYGMCCQKCKASCLGGKMGYEILSGFEFVDLVYAFPFSASGSRGEQA